jgi:hypothetical protein
VRQRTASLRNRNQHHRVGSGRCLPVAEHVWVHL